MQSTNAGVNVNKLRLYRLYKERISPETYVAHNMSRQYRRLLAKFRSGSLPLRIETGRYDDVPLKDRICSFCTSNQIESEIHVLLECDLYSDLRYELEQHLQNTIADFKTLPLFLRFLNVMTNNSCQYYLAKFLFLMFKRRKLYDHK